MKKIIITIPFLILLAGCSERYRYPCQDPENWGEKFCQKPYCSANGTCPSDLTHYDKDKVINGNNKFIPQTGACK